MATLDRQKPYGEITGDTEGRKYEQDGKFFGWHGDEIVDKSKQASLAKPIAPKPAAAAGQALAKTEVDDQLAKQ